jgi:gamma-glutamyltranspeptidase
LRWCGASEEKLYALNGSGRAQAAVTLDTYYTRGLSRTDPVPFTGLLYSLGVMGGPMQPQDHLQVAINLTDLEMDPQRALDAPRFRVLGGRKVTLEPGVPAEEVEKLRRRGHEIAPPDLPGRYGGGQIIQIGPENGRAGRRVGPEEGWGCDRVLNAV